MKHNFHDTFYIYENLPLGGAKKLFISNIKFFRKKIQLIKIKYSHKKTTKFNNIIDYLFQTIIVDNIHAYLYSKKLDDKKTLIAFHDWTTKSPNIFKYFKGKIIYICHEVPREFYDNEHIATQGFKEKIVNILRWPIKINDYVNISIPKRNGKLTIIANSKFQSSIINKTYGITSKVVYPGIPHVKIREREFDEKASKPVTILYLSAFNKLKNQMHLIKVAKMMNLSQNSNIQIKFIGRSSDKDYLNMLKSEIVKYRLNIKILINKSDKFIAQELLKGSILIFSPISEPFGMVILEGMANGLALVTSKNGGGYTEILNNKTGYIVSDYIGDWKYALNQLLNNNNKLRKFQKYNYTNSKNYSELVMNNNLWQIIKSTQ